MKKIFILIFFTGIGITYAQRSKHIFSKDPIINLENFQQKRVYFGFFLGLNSYDFKINYKENNTNDILVKKSTGFDLGLITDLKLHEYVNLRFEPGFYNTRRDLYYPDSNFALPNPNVMPTNAGNKIREVNSTYIHLPLLLKFSSLRTGNVRPYLLSGLSATLNLSSNSKAIDDNFNQRFRVKPWTTNYELGFGIDIFSEYFIFSPSVRGVFGLKDELIRDNPINGKSPWTGNIESMKTRAILINFSFH